MTIKSGILFALALPFMLCTVFSAHAQQPFVTDDVDVTEKGKFHLEIANEFDRLQTGAPVDFQNAARATLAYGVWDRIEVSITGQFLTFINSERPRVVAGFSDTLFAVKYNFLRERKGSIRPAAAISGFVQVPTGDRARGLGSGLYDFGLNGIAQKTIREKNIMRVNAGLLFSGNTQTGALGILSVRGQIFTGGLSYVRELGEKLQLGVEVTGAVTNTFRLSRGQLQTQFGGNYRVGERTTLDFGVIVGRFSASPRFGLLVGFSHDF